MKLIRETAGQYVLTDNTKAVHVVQQANGKWLAYASYDKSMVTEELATMRLAIHYAKHMLLND